MHGSTLDSRLTAAIDPELVQIAWWGGAHLNPLQLLGGGSDPPSGLCQLLGRGLDPPQAPTGNCWGGRGQRAGGSGERAARPAPPPSRMPFTAQFYGVFITYLLQ